MLKLARRDWVRTVAGVLLLVSAFALTLNYRGLSRWSGSYLLASNLGGAQDRELRLLSSTVPRVTYVRADGEMAVGIAQGKPLATRLYDPSGKVVAEGLPQIERVVGSVSTAEGAPALRMYASALIVGCLLGLAFAPALQRRPEVPLLVAACFSVAKARMVCSTCLPSATIGAVDAAWLGAGLYVCAAAGCMAFGDRARVFAAGAAGGAMVWQVGRLFADVPDCAMCQAILGLNAALLSSAVMTEHQPIVVRAAGWRRFAGVACVAVPAAVVSQPVADRAHETAVSSKIDYTGQPIDVLLPKVKVPKEGLLVMFGKPTCAPCADAHAALSRWSPCLSSPSRSSVATRPRGGAACLCPTIAVK